MKVEKDSAAEAKLEAKMSGMKMPAKKKAAKKKKK